MNPDRVLLFVHLFGVVLWVGSFVTYPFWSAAARRQGGEAVAFTYHILARVNMLVTMPGYWLTVIGGIGLVVVRYRTASQPLWLVFMEVVGLLLFFAALGVFDPRQRKLARLAAGTDLAAFKSLNRQHAVTASVAGVLMILVVVAATIKPGL